jgi:hypothetical protein
MLFVTFLAYSRDIQGESLIGPGLAVDGKSFFAATVTLPWRVNFQSFQEGQHWCENRLEAGRLNPETNMVLASYVVAAVEGTLFGGLAHANFSSVKPVVAGMRNFGASKSNKVCNPD